MTKKIRAIVSMILVVIMCLTMTMSVLAAEAIDGTTPVETLPGKTEDVDVKITIEKTENADGSTTTTTETTANNDVTASGSVVDYNASSEVVTDGEDIISGNSESNYTAVNGNYTATGGSEGYLEVTAPEVTVDVPLTTEEGENQNTVEGPDAVGDTTASGDLPVSSSDGSYNYESETVVDAGGVTITTTTVTTTESVDGNNTKLEFVYAETTPDANNDMTIVNGLPEIPGEGDEMPEVKDGMAFVLIGAGNASQFYPAYLYREPQKEGEEPCFVDENGNKYYNAGGGWNIEGIYRDGELVYDYDTVVKARWDNIAQYIMIDPVTGKLNTVYCADRETPSEDGYSYNMENIEDADYYTEEQAAMIRAIAKHGYWGVLDDKTTEEAEMGSLEAMKAMMSEARDANGNPVFTEADIALLNDGAAMTVTQMAIWTFSNYMSDVEFMNVQYLPKDENNESTLSWSASLKDVPESERATVDLIFKLYEYMIALEPDEIEKATTANTIINSQNFIEDMSVTIIEKDKSHANNQDNDSDNDAYVTDLSFALVVTPSTDNGDSMIVKVIGSDGETVLAEGRIAGEAQEGETMMYADKNGNFTFTGITLVEGNTNFHITLEGIQNLEEGVYLYTSEIRNDVASQTMVGFAEGQHSVEVAMEIEFNLDVDDKVVAKEKVWRSHRTRNRPPRNTPPSDPPTSNPPDDPEDETEILDEEVPLAAAPETGDISLIYAAFSAVSAMGIAGLQLTKKRERK